MRILSLFALLLLGTLSSFAQGHRHHHRPSPEKIAEALELTEAQQEQWKALHQDMRKQGQAHREKGERPSPEERRAHRKAHETALQEILTAEQWEKFQAMRPQAPREKMKAELGLSPEQEQQLEALHQKAHKQGQAERQRLQEGGFPDLVRYYEQREAHRQAMQDILTEEQWKKMEAKRTARQAKRKAHREAHKAEHTAKRKALRAYRKDNIRPLMLELRADLETQLSDTDKERLAELRPRYRAFRKALKQVRKTQEDKHSREAAQAAQAVLDQYRTDIQALRILLEKYESNIAALLKSIPQEQRQTWRSDMGELRQEANEEASPRHKRGRGHKGQHKPRISAMLWGGKQQQKALRFLLLEPQSATAQNIERQLKAYPSPAAERQTLSFEVLQKGEVRVELFRQSGEPVRLLLQQELPEGMHDLDVDLANLPTGSYFYRISDAKGSNSLAFIKR